MNVHPFGTPIPINPDNVPENQLYGSGTNRPVGFSFGSFFKLYWTVRNYQVGVQVVSQNDPLSQFLNGGGNFTLLGALAGLSNVDLGSTSSISGYTKIKNTFSQKKRKGERELGKQIDLFTMQGVVDGQTQKKIQIGNNIPALASTNATVNEGTIANAGPIHSLNQGAFSNVTIDFSNVKYYQGLYWPIIIINLSIASSVSSAGTYGQILGGVNFDLATKLIPLFTTQNNPTSLSNTCYGNILIGTRCGDRFLYDDKDEIRKQNGCIGLN